MCGIAGIHRLTDKPFKKGDRMVSLLLDGIDSRGGDATGYVAINDSGDIQLQKASCRAETFNKHRSYISRDFRTILLHTRFATQGKPCFPENNHPVEVNGIYVTHNGIIWNDDSIYKNSPYDRMGEVDTWAIPAIVAEKGWDNGVKALEELDGDLAIAMINVHNPRDLILAKGNGSPLVIVETEDYIVWASTTMAIREAWGKCLGTPPSMKRFTYLNDGVALRFSDGKCEIERFTPGHSWSKQNYHYMDKWAWDDDEYDVRGMNGLGSEDKSTKSTKSTDISLYQPHDLENIAEKLVENWEEEIIDSRRGLLVDGEILYLDSNDALMCEDCQDWYPSHEMSTVNYYGIKSLMCPQCAILADEEMQDYAAKKDRPYYTLSEEERAKFLSNLDR